MKRIRTMKRIRSFFLAVALVAAMLPALASAQPVAVPSRIWTCHMYGSYFWQWHCHY